jgi:hypothetical protein
MEISVILSIIGIALIVTLFVTAYNLMKIREVEHSVPQKLGKSLADSIKELNPDKRYIIALPSSMSEEDFDTAFAVLRSHLDLENSDTHIVIMHGNISMVEFS